MTEENQKEAAETDTPQQPIIKLFKMASTGEEFIGNFLGVIPATEATDDAEATTERVIVQEPVVIATDKEDKMQFVQWCMMSKDRVFNFSPELFIMVIDVRDDIADEYRKLILTPPAEDADETVEDAEEV